MKWMQNAWPVSMAWFRFHENRNGFPPTQTSNSSTELFSGISWWAIWARCPWPSVGTSYIVHKIADHTFWTMVFCSIIGAYLLGNTIACHIVVPEPAPYSHSMSRSTAAPQGELFRLHLSIIAMRFISLLKHSPCKCCLSSGSLPVWTKKNLLHNLIQHYNWDREGKTVALQFVLKVSQRRTAIRPQTNFLYQKSCAFFKRSSWSQWQSP